MRLQPAAPLIVPCLQRRGAVGVRAGWKPRRPSPKLADGRKLESACGGVRAHRALRAPEHHCSARGRPSAGDMRAKPFTLLFGPGAMTRTNYHGVHLSM